MEKRTEVDKNLSIEEFELRLQRSAAGRKENSRGKLVGALLRKACNAEGVAGDDNNLSAIDGVPVRFHTVRGKTVFSINPTTEPALLIAAFNLDELRPDRPARYFLYGIRLADCLKIAAKPTGARFNVSLSQVARVRLGEAYVPPEYTDAETVVERIDLKDRIEKLPAEILDRIMDEETKRHIDDFVRSTSREGRST